MTTTQWITLFASLLAFVASLFASAVAWHNGRFRRFTQQRIWERKAEAYQGIIDALSELVYFHETHLRAAEEHRDLSDERRAVASVRRRRQGGAPAMTARSHRPSARTRHR